MNMRIVIAVIAMLVAFSLAEARMYQWIAEDGSVTLKDTPPPATRNNKKVLVYDDSDFAPAPPQQPAAVTRTVRKTAQPAPSRKTRFSGSVEIYVTDWCGYCKKALAYLKSHNIPYVAYNIETDADARQRHKELGGRGVPLIIIGPNRMSGFSSEKLEYYLDNSE